MAEVNEKELRKLSWCVTRWRYSSNDKKRVDNRLTIKAFDLSNPNCPLEWYGFDASMSFI